MPSCRLLRWLLAANADAAHHQLGGDLPPCAVILTPVSGPVQERAPSATLHCAAAPCTLRRPNKHGQAKRALRARTLAAPTHPERAGCLLASAPQRRHIAAHATGCLPAGGQARVSVLMLNAVRAPNGLRHLGARMPMKQGKQHSMPSRNSFCMHRVSSAAAHTHSGQEVVLGAATEVVALPLKVHCPRVWHLRAGRHFG